MEGVHECVQAALIKKEELRKAYDQVNAQGNVLLLFSLQWKDLEEHFDSIGRSLNERFRTVEAREQVTEERIKAAELKEETIRSMLQRYYECELEISKKEDRLGFLKQQIECFGQEMVEKETLLISQRLESDRLALKEKELSSVLQRLELKICSKEENLGSLQQKIESCSQEMKEKEMSLDSMEERLSKCTIECENKETQLKTLRCDSDRCYLEIEKAKNVLSSMNTTFMSKEIEIRTKEERLGFLQTKLEERSGELSSVEISIQDCSKLLDSKKKELEVEIHTKEEKLRFLQERFDFYKREMREMVIAIDSMEDSLSKFKMECRNKESELNSLRCESDQCRLEIEKVKNELSLMNTRFELEEERSGELSLIEISIQNCSKQLDLKNEELSLIQSLLDTKEEKLNSIEERLKEKEFKLQQEGQSTHTDNGSGGQSEKRTLRRSKRKHPPASDPRKPY